MHAMSQQRISLGSYWRLVRGNANFRRLWAAQIVSEMGDWFYMVSLYAMLLEFTGKAESVSMAFVLQVLPQALVGPFAGIINDRISRRKVMIATDLARAVIVGCVLLVRTPAMVWLIYPLLFLETTMWGLFEPARTAVIPNVVEKDETLVANTLASSTWSINLFLGAALGGAAAVWLGRDAVFALDAASFLFSAFMISRMRFTEPHLEARGPARMRDLFDHSDVVEGFRYVRDHRLFTPLVVKGALGVTGASWVIFPVLGKQVFPLHRAGMSAEQGVLLGISMLMGARGLGTLLGPLAVAPWAAQRTGRLRLGIVLGFALYGLGYVALGGISTAPVAYAAVIFSHMGGAMVWVFSTTLLQLLTQDRFRGRVFAAELAFCTVMLAISAAAAGYAIDHGVDVRMVSFVTGLVTLVAGAAWAVFGVRSSANETK